MADINISTTQLPAQQVGVSEDVGQNLIKNADFSSFPTFVAAQTSQNRWNVGTAAGSTTDNTYYWGAGGIAASASCQFDTSTFHSGSASMRIDCLNTSGHMTVSNNPTSAIVSYDLTPIYGSAAYTFTGWIKTNNVATNAAFIDIREYSSALAQVGSTHTSTKFTGTNDWTQVTISFTSNASAVYANIILRNDVAGNISTAWFDDLSLTANSSPFGHVDITLGAIVQPGIQTINGPKIWS